jgi:hypothetical protein
VYVATKPWRGPTRSGRARGEVVVSGEVAVVDEILAGVPGVIGPCVRRQPSRTRSSTWHFPVSLVPCTCFLVYAPFHARHAASPRYLRREKSVRFSC